MKCVALRQWKRNNLNELSSKDDENDDERLKQVRQKEAASHDVERQDMQCIIVAANGGHDEHRFDQGDG